MSASWAELACCGCCCGCCGSGEESLELSSCFGEGLGGSTPTTEEVIACNFAKLLTHYLIKIPVVFLLRRRGLFRLVLLLLLLVVIALDLFEQQAYALPNILKENTL